MENITFLIKQKSDISTCVENILKDKFTISPLETPQSIKKLTSFLDTLSDDLWVVIEYPYVDKTYRDSYYGYYASKRFEYARNTIKISFFNHPIEDSDFKIKDRVDIIKGYYKGFLVIRPTFPQIIGRNVIEKTLLKTPGSLTCSVNYTSTALGIKFSVEGFPHCSQDKETITCAETTIWSIMEYFGYRYAEYTPSSPLKITEILSNFSHERLLPSKGLTAEQMSFAMKEFGFGVRIYSKKHHKEEFARILKIYIESGIPVIGVLTNPQGIAHSVTIIGRKSPTEMEYIKLHTLEHVIEKDIEIKDFSDIDFDLVVMDDNHPPYQLTKVDSPSSYYTDPKWADCSLANIIVPLYHKIYLEAGEARKISISFIKTSPHIKNNQELIFKTFLTSSRSFKNEVALNDTIDETVKAFLLATSMPKFIWITELYDNELAKKDLVSGMLIIDATELKSSGIIAVVLENIYIASGNRPVQTIPIEIKPFLHYQNNLK